MGASICWGIGALEVGCCCGAGAMIGAAMPLFEEVEEDVDDDLRDPCCVTTDAAVLPFDEREDLRAFRGERDDEDEDDDLRASFSASTLSTWYAFMPLLK